MKNLKAVAGFSGLALASVLAYLGYIDTAAGVLLATTPAATTGDGDGDDDDGGKPTRMKLSDVLDGARAAATEAVTAVKDEVTSALEKLNTRLDGMEQERSDGGDDTFRRRAPWVAGNAPAVITNITKASELYSFQRVARAIREKDWSIAKDEKQVSDDLRAWGYGSEDGTILIPSDPTQIAYVYEQMKSAHSARPDLSYIYEKCMASPEVIHYTRQFLPRNKQQQVFGDDSLGGALVATPLAGTIIELMRAKTVMVEAGAQTLPLPPSGRLSWARETSDPTWSYTDENAEITASTAKYGNILFVAKKAAALVKLSNESIKFTNPSIEAAIRNALAESGARFKDKQFLQGEGGTGAPQGVINFGNINSLNASTQTANGDTFDPEDPALVLSDLETKNHEPTAFIMRPGIWWRALNRRGDAVAASDGKGDFLHVLTRVSPTGPPSGFLGVPVLRSSAVSATRTKASGTTNTFVLAGDFRKAIIAEAAVMEISASNEAGTAFEKDQTWLRAIMHHDFNLTHEDAFTLVDNLKEDA